MSHHISRLSALLESVNLDSSASALFRKIITVASSKESVRIQVCRIKEKPARWRGKSLPKSDYATSKANSGFGPNDQQPRDDDTKEDKDDDFRENDRSNDDGRKEDEDEDPNSGNAAAHDDAVDPKAFYGYLFELDKKPTEKLDRLLRGIANYIVRCSRIMVSSIDLHLTDRPCRADQREVFIT